MSAALEASLATDAGALGASAGPFAAVMRDLAARSMAAYRDLVYETPELLAYFTAACANGGGRRGGGGWVS